MSGHALVDHGRLLDVLGIEGELLVDLARTLAPDRPVRTCPGWNIDEVIRHVGSVYRSVLMWLAERRRPSDWPRDPAPSQTTTQYLSAGLAELITQLRARDPAQRTATWWPADETYGFWIRRMAHETSMHRMDVQHAGRVAVTTIEDDIAVDGVDEVLVLWFGYRLSLLGLTGTRESSVAVCAGDYTWFARAGPSGASAWQCTGEQAAQAEATVSGSPMQLYSWLWGRAGPGSVNYEGDHDSIGQLGALLRLATR